MVITIGSNRTYVRNDEVAKVVWGQAMDIAKEYPSFQLTCKSKMKGPNACFMSVDTLEEDCQLYMLLVRTFDISARGDFIGIALEEGEDFCDVCLTTDALE